MNEGIRTRLHALIDEVAQHPVATFYADIWGDMRAFSELPTISRKDVRQVPLSRRMYIEQPGMTRTITDSDGMFGHQYSFEELNQEAYGPVGTRPLVYVADAHEAIEKSLWCYAHGAVPLIGEKDITITAHTSKAYNVNSLLVDEVSCVRFLEHIQQHTETLSSIMIFGRTFEYEVLMQASVCARDVRALLSLPEVGAFAVAVPDEVPQFTVLPGCVIESDGELIVTKLGPRAFPVIRYRTGIQAPEFVGVRTAGDTL